MICGKIPIRWMIAVMIFFVCIVSSINRGIMSITILAMTKPIYNNTVNVSVPDYGPRYEWSAYDQGLVIGSYFWGQLMIVGIAGVFTERYGARKITGSAITMATMIFAFTPVAANFLWLAIVLRFCVGLLTGTTEISLQALIANWAPPEEKGKFLSAYMVYGIGNVIVLSMSGFVIEYLGWVYCFHIVSLILGIHATAWYLIVYDSPDIHPCISASEKEFIFSKLNSSSSKKKHWPPFLSILSSIPFWALVCFDYGSMYALYLLLTAAPKYLNEVHRFDISSTGILSSVPYFVRFIFAICFGSIGDFLVKNKLMNVNAIRKSFSIFSHFIPAGFFIAILFVGNRPYVCIAFMTLALGFGGANSITALQNPHDIAPNFAATISGFILTISTTAGLISPVIVAYFTKERSSEEEWRYVFLIAAVIYIGSALIFLIFGSGYVQEWNNVIEDTNEMQKQSHLTSDNLVNRIENKSENK